MPFKPPASTPSPFSPSQRLWATLRLMRLSNALPAAGLVLLGGRLARVSPLPAQVGLAAAAMGCITAYGYVSNDLSDLAEDRVNKPDRPLPSGAVERRTARRLAAFLALLGLLLAVGIGVAPALVALLALALLTQYNQGWKSTAGGGNLLIGGLAGGTLLVGGYAGSGMTGVLANALPGAVLFTFITARELLKTAEDVAGDRAAGKRTAATEHGSRMGRAPGRPPGRDHRPAQPAAGHHSGLFLGLFRRHRPGGGWGADLRRGLSLARCQPGTGQPLFGPAQRQLLCRAVGFVVGMIVDAFLRVCYTIIRTLSPFEYSILELPMTVSLAPPKTAKAIKKKKRTSPSPVQSSVLPEPSTPYVAYLRAADANPLLRVELIEEKIHMSPAPRPKHQRIAMSFHSLFRALLKDHDIGLILASPIDVILSPRRTVVQPDLVFVAKDRIETLLTDTAIVGAPDMVVEILSPSTAQIDRTSKRQTYAEHGSERILAGRCGRPNPGAAHPDRGPLYGGRCVYAVRHHRRGHLR